MPARRLVAEGSYAYCRNPMTLGVTAYYLGVSIWIGSPFSIGLTALSAALIMAYIKFIEEKELEARFGQEYIRYKKRAPFLIPKRRKKGDWPLKITQAFTKLQSEFLSLCPNDF
ncbi:isoprenylcysteine carboxylmethyltransferase family protein [Candidatus Bathyarchaeota archaeon]|nr:isoprenylcysteine carboxylmethyltransferase family protein [Candidatus Bathyarchaeota archaeon]